MSERSRRPHAWAAALVLPFALCLACDATPFTLTVRVQSGLRAGYEARHVEVRLYDGAVPCRGGGRVRDTGGRALEAADQAALASGSLTVAELGGLSAGTYTARALVRRPPSDPRAAADEGEVVLTRCVVVAVSADRVLRLPLTADCLGVECPLAVGSPSFTECLNGRCVDPRCIPDEPSTHELCCDRAVLGSACDAEPTLCAVSADCPDARCSEPTTCDDGVCVESAVDLCAEGFYCARALGECRPATPLPAAVDAGVLEAPDARTVLDAGLPIPASISLASTFVGMIDVTGLAARPAGLLVTGHHGGSYTLFSNAGSGMRPQGFYWTTDSSTGEFFDLSGAWAPEDGPHVAIIDGANVITGSGIGAIAPRGCASVTTNARDGYVLVVAPGGCRFLRNTAAAGSETMGVPVGWRDGTGSWQALVPIRAETGAFGATFAAGAVMGFPIASGSTGTPARTWTLSFQPRALAVHGDDLIVVGDNGNVVDIDLTRPESEPPRWSGVWSHGEGLWTSLLGVTADATGIYAVGSVTSRGTPALPGGDDAWVIAAGLDGARRWDLVFGGLADDHARVVASSGGSLYVGGVAAGPTLAGFRSGPASGVEAILVELDQSSGAVTGVQRVADGSTVALTVGPTGIVSFATERLVHTLR